jgi:hypothetical protein
MYKEVLHDEVLDDKDRPMGLVLDDTLLDVVMNEEALDVLDVLNVDQLEKN